MSDEELAAQARDGANGEPVDKYGNREGELKYCCFPDCGCDGARLCMAEEGPSLGAIGLNVEKGSRKP